MILPIYLNNVVGDPKRRAGEAKIRPHVDQLVYVEGIFDAELLGRANNKRGIRFQPTPEKREYVGKNGIIELIKSHSRNSYGIVDMDHDFASYTIKDSPRINDTSSKCCLQALFLNEEACSEFHLQLGKRLFPKQSLVSQKFLKELRGNWPLLVSVAKERTYARLFRGKNGKRNKYRFGTHDRDSWPSIQEIINLRKGCIRDLIPAEHNDDYIEFRRKYLEKLTQIGINDHALEEVLGPFILHFNKSLPKHRIRKEIENAVLRCVTNRTHRDTVKHLLRHLS